MKEERRASTKSKKLEVLPPFIKGQSHALPGQRKKIRSEHKKKRRDRFSPIQKKMAPSSTIDRAELTDDMSKFYKDLSSSSDSSISDHLCKLKTLFKGTDLEKRYSPE